MALVDHFQRARRAGHRDHALRRAEVVRGDHARRRRRGVQRQPRDVRADLPPDLRLARRQPGPRHGRPPRAAGVDRRRGARVPHARASRRSPSTWRASTRICRRSTASAARWRRSGSSWPRSRTTCGRASRRSRSASSGPSARPTTPCSSACATPGARLTASSRTRGRRPARSPTPPPRRDSSRAAAASHDRAACSTGETGHLRADARAALDAVAGRVRDGSDTGDAGALLPPEQPPAIPLETGVRVRVPPGLEGVVTSVQGKTAEVERQRQAAARRRRRPRRDRPAGRAAAGHRAGQRHHDVVANRPRRT